MKSFLFNREIMKNCSIFMLLTIVILSACNSGTSEDSMEKWKSEIVQTEKDFAEMAVQEGISKSFLAFAAEDVVVKRGKKLIIGRDSLKESYENRPPQQGTVTLTWKPDFVDVAASGDLGYTYGKYVYTATDTSGVVSIDSGIFHTVWKRQLDGRWKFVWD